MKHRSSTDSRLSVPRRSYRVRPVKYDDFPLMSFALDLQGTMISVNGPGAEQLGYSSRELRGHPLAKVVHRDDQGLVAENLTAAARNPGHVTQAELRKVRKDGNIVWVHQQVWSAERSASPVLFAVCANITRQKQAEQELREYQERLRALTFELSLADERARRRLSLGVHDHIGQALAGARLRLERLIQEAAEPARAGDLCHVRALIDEAIQGTRSLTFELSSPVLYELGLEAALESVGRQTLLEHGIKFTFSAYGTPRRLPRDAEVVVYRTIRELLHNVVKHAYASHASVTVRYGEQEELVTLTDDGRGFDPQAVGRGFCRQGGFGLFSIREQLRQLGGWLRTQSAPGRGTTVEVGVPW